MRRIVFILAVLLFSSCVFAQGQKLVEKGVGSAIKRNSGKVVKNISDLSVRSSFGLAPFKKVNEAIVKSSLETAVVKSWELSNVWKKPYTKDLVNKHIRSAMVEIYAWDDSKMSGFIFSAVERGHEKLWVLVPAKVIHWTEMNVRLTFLDGSVRDIKMKVAAKGLGFLTGADVALLEMPPEFYGKVFALKWAAKLPEPGELVETHGFYGGRTRVYDKNGNREILLASGFKIVSDYAFEEYGKGACGGPLIDAQGYVVGMHSGSRAKRWSFAISRLAAEDLLRYYYTGSAVRALKYKGKTVGHVNITESVDYITIIRNAEDVRSISLNESTDYFWYEELEKTFLLEPGDEVRIDINRFGVDGARAVEFIWEEN